MRDSLQQECQMYTLQSECLKVSLIFLCNVKTSFMSGVRNKPSHPLQDGKPSIWFGERPCSATCLQKRANPPTVLGAAVRSCDFISPRTGWETCLSHGDLVQSCLVCSQIMKPILNVQRTSKTSQILLSGGLRQIDFASLAYTNVSEVIESKRFRSSSYKITALT